MNQDKQVVGATPTWTPPRFSPLTLSSLCSYRKPCADDLIALLFLFTSAHHAHVALRACSKHKQRRFCFIEREAIIYAELIYARSTAVDPPR